jgi:hypothetical protein
MTAMWEVGGKALMRIICFALALFGFSAVGSAAFAQYMHQDEDGKWVNESGGNLYGDSRFNLDADPRFNLNADPRFNLDADRRFNLDADPRFSIDGDRRYQHHGGMDDEDE